MSNAEVVFRSYIFPVMRGKLNLCCTANVDGIRSLRYEPQGCMFCGAGVAVIGQRHGHYPDCCCLEVSSKDSKQHRALAGEKCVWGTETVTVFSCYVQKIKVKLKQFILIKLLIYIPQVINRSLDLASVSLSLKASSE